MNVMRSHILVCLPAITILFLLAPLPQTWADDWPQWRGPGRDGVWKETGIVERFSTAQVKLRWRTPISSGYSGPTVADGRVFVTDRVVQPEQCERVHCFDAQSGQPRWTCTYDCRYLSVGYKAGPP